MMLRNTLYTLTLIAYTLSLAHSVIPHHHHSSAQEATAHQHEDDHHHHDTDHHEHNDADTEGEDSNGSDTGHFFFFSHDLNADVLTQHGSVDNPVKEKKASHSLSRKEQVKPFEVSRHLVFHPPQDDPSFYLAPSCHSDLRGPPIPLT